MMMVKLLCQLSDRINFIVVLSALGLFSLVNLSTASAQQRSTTLPGNDFLITKIMLNDGDYVKALKYFQKAGRGAFKGVGGLWLDSICHYAMVGEVHYKVGNLEKALQAYDNSLHLYLAYHQWMLRVQWPKTLMPAGANAKFVRRCPWGNSKRRVVYLNLPFKMLVQKGNINNQGAVQNGGVINPAIFRKVLVVEVHRCAALAQRRRMEILGPLCKEHPLTKKYKEGFSAPHTTPNHWSQTYNYLQAGLSQAAAGQHAQAIIALRRSLLIASKYDHDLTCVALLELGKLTLQAKQTEKAAEYFLEASYSAFRFENYQVLEEALRYGSMVHLIRQAKGVYQPLVAAATWAKIKRLRELQTSLTISLAENYNVLRNQKGANGALSAAQFYITRDMKNSAIAARFYWQAAIHQFQSKQAKLQKSAIVDLNTALNYQRRGSLRLFQIALVDLQWTKKIVGNWDFSPRIALNLYEKVLRDPTNLDWQSSPMETISVLTTAHSLAYEHWFEVCMQEKKVEKAIIVAEKTLRHRYYSTLPLGGRLLSLRWVMAGPISVLDQTARQQRQVLLRKYTTFAKLSGASDELRKRLKLAPLLPKEKETQKKQAADLLAMVKVSDQQEIILKEIALQREPSSFVFPPILSLTELQKSLPDDQALWFFFSTQKNLYSFMFNNKRYGHWIVRDPSALRASVGDMLREIGNYSANQSVSVTRISGTAWKKPASKVVELLLAGSNIALDKFPSEVTIVPAGPLWYLPFEALPLGKDPKAGTLISKCRVRYAPTASLSVPLIKTSANGSRVAIKIGTLHAAESKEATRDAFNELKKIMPQATAITGNLPVASPLFSSMLDGLIVFDDLEFKNTGLYGWTPFPADKILQRGALIGWFNLPWGGPTYMILPGFHTHAEHGFRKKGTKPMGEEIFLSMCGLMSTGTRTVLISRWRTGGKTCYDLIREFTQELPFTSAADAWQRSVMLAKLEKLDHEQEPRVKKPKKDQLPNTAHPFFWAGYLLIDSGVKPKN